MTDLFTDILNMSITASYVALVVISVRLILRKAPKIFSYALWSVVLFRLICPFSFSSGLSFLGVLKPHNNNMVQNVVTQQPIIQLSKESIKRVANNTLSAVTPIASENSMITVMDIAAVIWIVTIVILLIYSMVSYLKIKKRVRYATMGKDNIFESDRITTPFVLGFIHPKIYIPSHIKPSELTYVLQHEQTHIKRFDYLIKPFVFLVLIVHWFNPLMWLCYRLMSKDIEMSCDESVMRHTDVDIRGSYSKSLLALSVKQNGLFSPLAFGESNVKSRIKNVINYKKPVFWVGIIAVVAVVIVGVGLLTNPKEDNKPLAISEKLLDYKTEYVGDASKVGNIIWLLDYPEEVNYNYFELSTDNIPYGMTVHLKTNTEIRDYYTEASHGATFEKNAIILFSLIGNVDYINFNLSDGNKDYLIEYTRDWANDKVGKDVSEYAQEKEEFEQLLKILDNFQSTEGEKDGYSLESIEKNLEIIMSSPKTSSSPHAYIDAHKEEFDAIVALDTEALIYMFGQLGQNEQTGLKGSIMVVACRKILGEEDMVPYPTSNVEEWYNGLKETMQSYATKNSYEWVQKNYPKAAYILSEDD